MNDSTESLEKKRGRKKKEVNDVIVEKKKRGRKKKWESFGHTKIHVPDSDEEPITVNPVENIYSANYEKESVAFGNLNITVHTNKEYTNTDKIKNSISTNLDTVKKNSICKIDLNVSDIDSESDFEHNSTDITHSNKSIIYHKNIYSQGSELPRTDILCYNCCHSFFTKPFTLPIDYDPKTKRYKVFGNFCSPNCAKRYGLDDTKFNNKIYLLSQMCREMFGIGYVIKPAPSRFTLTCFGGKLSIDEYRNNFIDTKKYIVREINCKTVYLEIKEI